eukprot:jgi/Botrbrau1/10058/Bobra.0355s0014.1
MSIVTSLGGIQMRKHVNLVQHPKSASNPEGMLRAFLAAVEDVNKSGATVRVAGENALIDGIKDATGLRQIAKYISPFTAGHTYLRSDYSLFGHTYSSKYFATPEGRNKDADGLFQMLPPDLRSWLQNGRPEF